jgi:hypothetical protein
MAKNAIAHTAISRSKRGLHFVMPANQVLKTNTKSGFKTPSRPPPADKMLIGQKVGRNALFHLFRHSPEP